MKFVEKHYLYNRGPVDQAEDSDINNLLVSEKPVFTCYGNRSDKGSDRITWYLAFHSERCWLKKEVWIPRSYYSATGEQDSIVPFQEGLEQIIQSGGFDHLK